MELIEYRNQHVWLPDYSRKDEVKTQFDNHIDVFIVRVVVFDSIVGNQHHFIQQLFEINRAYDMVWNVTENLGYQLLEVVYLRSDRCICFTTYL